MSSLSGGAGLWPFRTLSFNLVAFCQHFLDETRHSSYSCTGIFIFCAHKIGNSSAPYNQLICLHDNCNFKDLVEAELFSLDIDASLTKKHQLFICLSVIQYLIGRFQSVSLVRAQLTCARLLLERWWQRHGRLRPEPNQTSCVSFPPWRWLCQPCVPHC